MVGTMAQPPNVMLEELKKFYDEHLSAPSIAIFGQTFSPLTSPQKDDFQITLDVEEEYAEDPQGKLGYYFDGTPRTLTNEQILMFRQSELKEILRNWNKRKALAEKMDIEPEFSVTDPAKDKRKQPHQLSREDGEETSESTASGQGRKKKKKKNAAAAKREPKPDLRKRTWDAVDTGLDSLEYD